MEKVICMKCGLELVPQKKALHYLGHKITQDFPACPKCGAVYIPEDVVREKMRSVEETMEDK